MSVVNVDQLYRKVRQERVTLTQDARVILLRMKQPLDGDSGAMRIVGDPVVPETPNGPEANTGAPASAEFVSRSHPRHARQVLVRALDGFAKPPRNIQAGVFRKIHIVSGEVPPRRRTLNGARDQLRRLFALFRTGSL